MLVPLSVFLQKAPTTILVILSIILAYQFALLSWHLFPSKTSVYQWVPVITHLETNTSKINTHKLQQLHLFGQDLSTNKIKKESELLKEAPQTKLHLVLVGVVAASDPLYSSAIISYKSKQDSYFVDSEIKGTSASISEIYEDRVILDVNGVLETLMLDGVDKSEASNKKFPPSTENNLATKVKPVALNIDRQDLIKNPGKLTDYIRISPFRKDGEILGYRLRPGKDKTMFEQAGFKRNDLAIALNGVDLTDKQQALSLMKEFSTMKNINLTVEREGQLYELSLNLQ